MARKSTFGRVFRRKWRGEWAPGYYVRVRLHGKETTRWGGPDRKTAAEFVARLLRESAREDLLGEKAIASASFAETEEAFRTAYKADHGEGTVRGDSGRIKRIVSWFGTRTIKAIDAGHVADFLVALRAEGRTPATVNRYASVLSAWFEFAVERAYATANLAKGRHLKEEVKPIPFVGDADLAAIGSKEPDPCYAAAYRFLGDTGLRRGEFARLERRDFDARRGVVIVRRSKAGEPREVPLTQTAREAIESLLGPLPMKGPDRVWGGAPDHLSRRFAAAARAAGFALTLHALRHSCASRLVQRGIPIPVVAKILGHKCLATTLRYTHLAPGATHDAIRALERPIPEQKGTGGGTGAPAVAKG
jgi:integrase